MSEEEEEQPKMENIEVKQKSELNNVYEYDISQENEKIFFCKKIDTVKAYILCGSTPITTMVVSILYLLYSFFMMIIFLTTKDTESGFTGLKSACKVLQVIITICLIGGIVLKTIALLKNDCMKSYYSYLFIMFTYLINVIAFIINFVYFSSIELDREALNHKDRNKSGYVVGFVIFGIILLGVIGVIAYFLLYLEFMLYLFLKYLKNVEKQPEPIMPSKNKKEGYYQINE